MIRLYVTPEGQQPYLLSFERAHVNVGSGADNDVRLQGTGISSRHFLLRRVGVDVVIEDCNSRNGTYVNRVKVAGPKVLGPEDLIQVVGFQLRLVMAEARPAKASTVTVSMSKGAAAGVAAAEPGGVRAVAPVLEPSRAEPTSAVAAGPEATVEEGSELPPGVDPVRLAALVGPRAQAWHERADLVHLLRGEDLHEAQLWAASGGRATPAARRHEQAFIVASGAAAGRRARRRWQVAGACVAAVLVGGWTARRVLAGGPDAHAPGLSRWAGEQFQERLTAARRTACQETSTRAAEAAQMEAQQSIETGLQRATEALRCVGEFRDLRGTAAERTTRALLGAVKGSTLERGERAVRAVAADPLGRVVAWGRDDGTVVVWDLERWQGSSDDGDGAPLKLLQISRDGGRLIAVSGSGEVRVWNLLDDAPVSRRITLDRPRGDVAAAALSADGWRLVLGSTTAGELRAFDLHDIAAQVPAVRLGGLNSPAEVLAVSADGARVFAAGATSVVGWRFSHGRLVGKPQVFAGHSADVTDMVFAACSEGQDDRWLVSGDSSGEVRMWELRGSGRKVLAGVKGGVRSLRASAGCRELIAAGLRDLWLWDLQLKDPGSAPKVFQIGATIEALALDGGRALVAAGTKVHACELAGTSCTDYSGHTQAIAALSLSEQSGWMITGAADGTARLWDARASTGLQSAQAHHADQVRGLSVSEDGHVLVAAGPHAKLWRITGVQPPREVRTLKGSPHDVLKAAALSPSGKRAATTADESVLLLWQIGDGRGELAPPIQVPTQGSLGRLSFSDDGAWLVGSGPTAACAVDLRVSGMPTCVDLGGSGEVVAQAFITGTHRVAVGLGDSEVRIIDLDDLTRGAAREQTLGRGKGRVRNLVSSPDGRWLAAFGENVDGRLWDLRAVGSAATQLGALTDKAPVAVFTPDRKWLVVGTGTKLLAWRLDRLDTSPALVRERLAASVTAMVMSADSRTLVTGGADGRVLAWEFARLADDAPVEFGSQGVKVNQMALVADGTLIVSTGPERTMHVWPLTGRRLWELASRVGGVAKAPP